jgi:hypothetical protein
MEIKHGWIQHILHYRCSRGDLVYSRIPWPALVRLHDRGGDLFDVDDDPLVGRSPCPSVAEAFKDLSSDRQGNRPVAAGLRIGDRHWPHALRYAGCHQYEDPRIPLCGGWTVERLRQVGCIAIYCYPAELLARCEESPLADPGEQRLSSLRLD